MTCSPLYALPTFVCSSVGACALGSVPMRMATSDLPVGGSCFVTGPFFSGMDHLKLITATRKLINQTFYGSLCNNHFQI